MTGRPSTPPPHPPGEESERIANRGSLPRPELLALCDAALEEINAEIAWIDAHRFIWWLPPRLRRWFR